MRLKNESNWLSDCLEDVKLLSYKSFSIISELKIAVLKAGCQESLECDLLSYLLHADR